MSNKNNTLPSFLVTVFFDNGGEQGSESVGVIGLLGLWRKLGETATREVDCQTRREVDETCEQRLKLGSATAESMDEDK